LTGDYYTNYYAFYSESGQGDGSSIFDFKSNIFFRKDSNLIFSQSKESLPRECGDNFVNSYIGEVCDYYYPTSTTREPVVRLELPLGYRLNRSDVDEKGLLYLEKFSIEYGEWITSAQLDLKKLCTKINKNDDFSDKVSLGKPNHNVMYSCTNDCKQYWEVLVCEDTDWIFNDGKKSYLVNLFDNSGKNFDFNPKIQLNPDLYSQPNSKTDYKPYSF